MALALLLAAPPITASCEAIFGCQPVAPRELPSGADPGTAVEDVEGGVKQFVWGTGADRLDLRVGVTYVGSGGSVLEEVEIRGVPGVAYRSELDPDAPIAISWTENGCDYTLFLDGSHSSEDAEAFAPRY